MPHIFTKRAFRLSQTVGTTVANRDGGFILCQVPPNDLLSLPT